MMRSLTRLLIVAALSFGLWLTGYGASRADNAARLPLTTDRPAPVASPTEILIDVVEDIAAPVDPGANSSAVPSEDTVEALIGALESAKASLEQLPISKSAPVAQDRLRQAGEIESLDPLPPQQPMDTLTPFIQALATTQNTLETDAASTSIVGALLSASEAADTQALAAAPATVDETVEHWMRSVKSFLGIR